MTLKTYYELATMDAETVWAYERSLGFIAPLFDAVTHADNLREEIQAKSSVPEVVMRVWRATWTYDNKKQQDYARMIFCKRGYHVVDAQSCMPSLERYPQLVTYLDG